MIFEEESGDAPLFFEYETDRETKCILKKEPAAGLGERAPLSESEKKTLCDSKVYRKPLFCVMHW